MDQEPDNLTDCNFAFGKSYCELKICLLYPIISTHEHDFISFAAINILVSITFLYLVRKLLFTQKIINYFYPTRLWIYRIPRLHELIKLLNLFSTPILNLVLNCVYRILCENGKLVIAILTNFEIIANNKIETILFYSISILKYDLIAFTAINIIFEPRNLFCIDGKKFYTRNIFIHFEHTLSRNYQLIISIQLLILKLPNIQGTQALDAALNHVYQNYTENGKILIALLSDSKRINNHNNELNAIVVYSRYSLHKIISKIFSCTFLINVLINLNSKSPDKMNASHMFYTSPLFGVLKDLFCCRCYWRYTTLRLVHLVRRLYLYQTALLTNFRRIVNNRMETSLLYYTSIYEYDSIALAAININSEPKTIFYLVERNSYTRNIFIYFKLTFLQKYRLIISIELLLLQLSNIQGTHKFDAFFEHVFQNYIEDGKLAIALPTNPERINSHKIDLNAIVEYSFYSPHKIISEIFICIFIFTSVRPYFTLKSQDKIRASPVLFTFLFFSCLKDLFCCICYFCSTTYRLLHLSTKLYFYQTLANYTKLVNTDEIGFVHDYVYFSPNSIFLFLLHISTDGNGMLVFEVMPTYTTFFHLPNLRLMILTLEVNLLTYSLDLAITEIYTFFLKMHIKVKHKPIIILTNRRYHYYHAPQILLVLKCTTSFMKIISSKPFFFETNNSFPTHKIESQNLRSTCQGPVQLYSRFSSIILTIVRKGVNTGVALKSRLTSIEVNLNTCLQGLTISHRMSLSIKYGSTIKTDHFNQSSNYHHNTKHFKFIYSSCKIPLEIFSKSRYVCFFAPLHSRVIQASSQHPQPCLKSKRNKMQKASVKGKAQAIYLIKLSDNLMKAIMPGVLTTVGLVPSVQSLLYLDCSYGAAVFILLSTEQKPKKLKMVSYLTGKIIQYKFRCGGHLNSIY